MYTSRLLWSNHSEIRTLCSSVGSVVCDHLSIGMVCDHSRMHATMQSRLGTDCQSTAPTFFQGMPNLSSIHLSNVSGFDVANLALGQQ